jgi:hypothetical protein
MSDEIAGASPDTAPVHDTEADPVVANAARVLAIKDLGEAVAGVRKQVKALWIAFAVLALITVVLAVLTLAPGLRFGMLGGRANPQRGTFTAPAGAGQTTGRGGGPGTGPGTGQGPGQGTGQGSGPATTQP